MFTILHTKISWMNGFKFQVWLNYDLAVIHIMAGQQTNGKAVTWTNTDHEIWLDLNGYSMFSDILNVIFNKL